MSTTTTNKSLTLPANGEDPNTWDVPVNQDFTDIDTALGGLTTISVTSASGTVVLSRTQYLPPQIKLTGTLTANVTYQVPSGVGGVWTVNNATSGSFSVTFSSGGGGTSTAVAQGYATIIACDGTNVIQAVTIGTAARQNIGTSGANVPLMSTANTFSAPQTFSVSSSGGIAASAFINNSASGASGNEAGLFFGPSSDPSGVPITAYRDGADNSIGWRRYVDTGGSRQAAEQISSAGAFRWFLYGAGTLTTDASGNITATSDAALKNVLGPFNRGLADLKAMAAPVIYDLKAELAGIAEAQAKVTEGTATPQEERVASLGHPTYAGWTAQGIETGVPEAVSVGPDGFKTVSDRALLAAFYNALMEIDQRLAAGGL